MIKPPCSHLLLLFLAITVLGCGNKNKQEPTKNPDSTTTQLSDEADPLFQKLTPNGALMIPGESIGGLSVGAKSSKNLKELGRPQKGDAGMCKSLGTWIYADSTQSVQPKLTVFLECDPDDDMRPHIKWIRTTDARFKTQKELGVGSSYSEVLKVYPDMKVLGTYTSTRDQQPMILLNAVQAGITFEVETQNGEPASSGTVRAVVVSKAGQSLSIAYFPFYNELELKN